MDNNDFDYEAYKKHFISMLKSPPVKSGIFFALLGIVVALGSGVLLSGRPQFIVCLLGCVITLVGSNKITTTINKANAAKDNAADNHEDQ